MLDRPKAGERAILVHLDLGCHNEADLAEFRELAISAGADVVAVVTGSRKIPEPKYFIGAGKAKAIATEVIAQHADVVLINHNLSPAQERNLEQLTDCRVISRTGLILDIFAQRAR